MFSCWQGSRANDRFLLLAREQTAVSGLAVYRVTRAKERGGEYKGKKNRRRKTRRIREGITRVVTDVE